MPQSDTKLGPMALTAVIVLAALLLAACGGSSSSSTSTSAAATSAAPAAGGGGASGPTGADGAGGARFSALRECLAKNGITLPKRGPRAGATGKGGFKGATGRGGFFGGGGGGFALPKGVNRAQYEAALKKCGGGFPGAGRGGFPGAGRGGFNSPARTAALTKFAACMRQNGINLPAPSTTGTGPIFNTKGIDTASTQFKTAESKCQSDLTGVFRRAGAGGGGAPQTG
jgi:hypothetical protein